MPVLPSESAARPSLYRDRDSRLFWLLPGRTAGPRPRASRSRSRRAIACVDRAGPSSAGHCAPAEPRREGAVGSQGRANAGGSRDGGVLAYSTGVPGSRSGRTPRAQDRPAAPRAARRRRGDRPPRHRKMPKIRARGVKKDRQIPVCKGRRDRLQARSSVSPTIRRRATEGAVMVPRACRTRQDRSPSGRRCRRRFEGTDCRARPAGG